MTDHYLRALSGAPHPPGIHPPATDHTTPAVAPVATPAATPVTAPVVCVPAPRTGDGGSPPPRGRRTATVMAAVTVAGLFAAATFAVAHRAAEPGPFLGGLRRTPSVSSAPGTPTPAPAGRVTYQDVAGVRLPVSSVDGPRVVTSTRARGFAHTDRGAALAAIHVLTRSFPFVGPRVFRPTIAEQVQGPSAETLARLTEQAYEEYAGTEGVTDGGPLPAVPAWAAGYQVRATGDPDAAVVQVLIGSGGADAGSGGFAEYTLQLSWIDGDWRLIAPDWGDWRQVARAVATPDPARYRSYDTGGILAAGTDSST